jgi:hypothetical protein
MIDFIKKHPLKVFIAYLALYALFELLQGWRVTGLGNILHWVFMPLILPIAFAPFLIPIAIVYFFFKTVGKKQKGPDEKRGDLTRYLLEEKKITVEEAAALLNLGIQESKELLDQICRDGLCEMHLTPKGNVIYVLKSVAEEEKLASFDPTEG